MSDTSSRFMFSPARAGFLAILMIVPMTGATCKSDINLPLAAPTENSNNYEFRIDDPEHSLLSKASIGPLNLDGPGAGYNAESGKGVLTGGTIPKGSTVTGIASGTFGSGAKLVEEHWSQNQASTNIPLREESAYASLNLNGSRTAVFVNLTDHDLSYSDLKIATNADASYLPGSIADGLSTGTLVPLDVPTSGFFAPGETTLATYFPSSDPFTFSGGSVELSDGLYGLAAESVPEPSSLILFGIGIGVLLFHACNRRRAAKSAAHKFGSVEAGGLLTQS